jgi:transcriptional regulator with XRE-family HTH domain
VRYRIEGFGEYFADLIDAGPYKSREEIANLIGVSTKSLDNYLSGDRRPGIGTCEAIAFTFGVSIAEVRAAAGKPLPTSIDSVFNKDIRSLMLGMDWTPRRLDELQAFLQGMEDEQEAQHEETPNDANGATPTSAPSIAS